MVPRKKHNLCYQNYILQNIKYRIIKIHQPRNDLCDICVGYKLVSVSEPVCNRHVNRKTMAREKKIKLRFQVPKLQ